MRAPHGVSFLACLLLSMVTACHAPPDRRGIVTFALGYIPNIQFAPYYVALEQGYFAAQGIRVHLEYLSEADLPKMVADGRFDFAAADGDSVILARNQGLPVRSILTQYQSHPGALIVPRGSQVSSVSQLRGKRIGIPEFFGSSYIGLRALLLAERLEEADFRILAIGYSQVAALTADRCDAVMGYLANEPVMLEESGFPVQVLPVADKADLVGPGLITRDDLLIGNRQMAQRVVRALRMGLETTIRNPGLAFEAARRHIPGLEDPQNERLQRRVLERSVPLWNSGDLVGWSRMESWRLTQQMLFDAGMIDRKIDPSLFFTNELLTGG